MYVKINEIYYQGFSTALDFYNEEERKCNNGEVDKGGEINYGEDYACNATENYCSQITERKKITYFNNYKKGIVEFSIYEDGGMYINFPTDFGGTYPCFAGGADMDSEGPVEVTITSDTDYYYVVSEIFGTCKITEDFHATCEKSPFIDEYTGKIISTFNG